MIDFCRLYFLANLNRMLLRSLLLSTLSTVSLSTGLAPTLSFSSSYLIFDTVAYAQEFSEADVKNYAATVLEAEETRKNSLNKIEEIMSRERPGQKVPEITCYEKEAWWSQVPESAQNVAENFCNEYARIVKKHFSSPTQFNQITKKVLEDKSLAERVQNEMRRLQNNP